MALRAGIVGCGRMGAQLSERLKGVLPSGWLPLSHAENIAEVPGLELRALAETNASRLREAAVNFEIKATYSDAHKMLLSESIDILSIATRTPEKAGIIKSGISAGVKGIYVEKPIANSLSKTLELVDLAKKSGCFLSYGVNRRFHQVYRKAKKLIESGELGALQQINIEFGRAPLLWSHPHSMDLLVYFGGNASKVRADLAPTTFNQTETLSVDSDPIIESAQVIFQNGVRGCISLGDGNVVRLFCSLGSLTIHGDGAFIQVSSKHNENSPYFHEQKFLYDQPTLGATNVAFRELCQAVNGDLTETQFFSRIAPEDIIAGQRLVFGCVWSHINQNQYIDVVDTPLNLLVTGRTGNLFA